MSIKSRISLKNEFVSGTAATQSKFEDVFDSHYNRYEDSILLGPVGVTGKYGLIGPEGPTTYNGLIGPEGATHYLGLWLDSTGATPISATSIGVQGTVIIDESYMYICTSTDNWIRLTGATSF